MPLRRPLIQEKWGPMKCNRSVWRAVGLEGAALVLLATAVAAAAQSGAPEALASAAVESSALAQGAVFDGVVEASRQTVVAAQVSGAVVEIRVRAGEAVQAGQMLLRLDARAAEQTASAGDAQVQAARAALDVARQEFERQKLLFDKQYISQGAFERAQAQFTATQAQVNAQLAQAGAARTQSGFYVVTAPYSGIVAEVPVTLGDMALPGRALLRLYDPAALRVTAMVPEASVAAGAAAKGAQVEVPGRVGGPAALVPIRVERLPLVDPATHSVELRLDLARGTRGLAPGMFARVRLPGAVALAAGGAAPEHLFVPQRSVLRRAELDAVYVVDAQGRAQLRQVRLGEAAGDKVEVLAGVSAQERVALDPQVAAHNR